jgi:transposase
VHVARLLNTPQQLNWERETTKGKGSKKRTITILVPKGLKQILAERGCLPIGKLPRGSCSPRCANSLIWPLKKTNKPPCCLARILANHKDFFEQKSALEELLLARGHKCLFLPKFHCELNPIEMYWAYCKNLYRQVWKTTFPEAREAYFKALDSCPLDTLRRYCNRALRFIDAYRKGLSVKQAAWCVKKQSGHRTISETIMKEFDIVPENEGEVDELA